MDALVFLVIYCLAVCLIVLIATLLRQAVRHTRGDERVAFLSGPSSIKILGPGWVIVNPFYGRPLLVSLKEQHCQPFMDEKATIKMSVSYRITDIEKAVDAGIRQGQMRLEMSNQPKKEKEKILQQGSFIDPVMENIRSLVLVYIFFSFKEVPQEYQEDVTKFAREINEFCMTRLQKTFSDKGIEITHVEIMSVV
jgi:hypothetical protein